jgi:hypothetical protein
VLLKTLIVGRAFWRTSDTVAGLENEAGGSQPTYSADIGRY